MSVEKIANIIRPEVLRWARDPMTVNQIVNIIRRERARRKPLVVTNEMRSMIATAFVGAYDYNVDIDKCKRRSLCCSRDSFFVCLSIVGARGSSDRTSRRLWRAAENLQAWAYEELGCCGWKDPDYQAEQEQYFLDKIAGLEVLSVGDTFDGFTQRRGIPKR